MSCPVAKVNASASQQLRRTIGGLVDPCSCPGGHPNRKLFPCKIWQHLHSQTFEQTLAVLSACPQNKVHTPPKKCCSPKVPVSGSENMAEHLTFHIQKSSLSHAEDGSDSPLASRATADAIPKGLWATQIGKMQWCAQDVSKRHVSSNHWKTAAKSKVQMQKRDFSETKN